MSTVNTYEQLTIEQKKTTATRAGWARAKKLITKHWQFYLFIIPAAAYIIIL